MARISELHYSNAYAASSGVSEFLEVALGPSDDPADFVVGFYQDDGTLGIEVTLDDPLVTVSVDPDNGEIIYVISADNFPILLTDPDGGGANNYEAYALTNTATNTVIDFYDIGGGTQNITAASGAAAGATSENLPVLVGPNSTTTTLQFNQPNPDTLVHEEESSGDTGIACFVAGTLIDTPSGARPIETLEVGDLVCTEDNGALPLRWVGKTTVMGYGSHAPILFEAGVFGTTAPLWVSPQHRILVRGWQAELYYGADEILVPAKALINGTTIRQVNIPFVTYLHLLFEDHQIIRSHGVLSESFDLASVDTAQWANTTALELKALFPMLQGRKDTQTARQVQTVHEGLLLRSVETGLPS